MSQIDPNTETEQTEPLLNEVEARILGALMEKQLATPDAYPLTLNSLVLACNQKTSREPITHLEAGEVQRCLSQMQDRKLIEVDYGSRANRYDQRLTRVLGLDKATQALLNVILLRGPQTLVELLTRTQRMFDFASPENLQEKLDQLCAKTHPIILRIPRQAGQREDRYMHLLCGKPDLSTIAAMGSSAKKTAAPELEERIEKLEAQVEQLHKLVEKLLDLNGVSLEDLCQ
ncbi:YceH family protein [Cellvibrio sp. ARAG 10.3]|uniref:YceH family protein n=1 Tax=Cellvibrio sp. ARAG 10.3 TaxID=3451358 RepID=UPI003F481E38